MTIKEAIEQLIETDVFKEAAKKESNLRVFLKRWRAGEIRNGAAVELLTQYGYEISAKKKKSVTIPPKE